MGRASSSKKVARAARAAGRPGTGRNWLWPMAVFVLFALGGTLIFLSRDANQNDAEATEPGFGDHWHAAYGVSNCGEYVAPLADAQGDANGIHTHEDGLVHIHPTSSNATGDNATFSVFAEEVDLGLEDDRLDLPGDGDAGPELVEGETECDGEPGIVQAAIWDDPADEEAEIRTSDLADVKFADGQIIAVAFAPEGAEIEKPPTAVRLQDATAAEEGRPLPEIEGAPEVPATTLPDSTSTTLPEDVTTTTVTPDSTAPADSTTTTAAP